MGRKRFRSNLTNRLWSRRRTSSDPNPANELECRLEIKLEDRSSVDRFARALNGVAAIEVILLCASDRWVTLFPSGKLTTTLGTDVKELWAKLRLDNDLMRAGSLNTSSRISLALDAITESDLMTLPWKSGPNMRLRDGAERTTSSSNNGVDSSLTRFDLKARSATNTSARLAPSQCNLTDSDENSELPL